MPYTPPVGTVNLNLSGSYTPPVGTVNLDLSPPGEDRSLTIAARTGGARAAIFAGSPIRATVAACTGGARVGATVAYDPNLLSDVVLVVGDRWRDGTPLQSSVVEHWQDAQTAIHNAGDQWQDAAPMSPSVVERWQQALPLTAASGDQWQEAARLSLDVGDRWQQATRVTTATGDHCQDADGQYASIESHWRDLPLLTRSLIDRFQDGTRLEIDRVDRFGDGARLAAVVIEVWQQAGYPGNAPNPQKDAIPTPVPTAWGTTLKINCPLPVTTLRIGRTPCILIADRELPIQRTYMSINSASLVRLPDLTPLPVTSMSIDTDFDSWCWRFSATLKTPDAWTLVQPNPLACEVLATINGYPWKFLLDVPSTQRRFNSDQVSLQGRSRSAWLHDPYTRPQDFSETNAREMQQLGDAALDNTGWTLDWQGENWLVPTGRYTSWNTPIGVLIRLAGATDDGLYTDPALQVITLQKRWPVASWLLDGAVVDMLIPEDAVRSLTQSPVYTAPYNGVYVSGESAGALALVKIAGTDGALQPENPIIHELLCDTSGVAARQRGLNALSDSGAGFTMDAELLFTPTVGLIHPGLMVSIAGMKGVSRSVKISAEWGSDGLAVWQSVGLERREVEA